MAISSTALMSDYMCDITSRWFSFWKENAKQVCPDEEDILGKVVIVTGSNTGIGKMIALQLANRGAVVIMAVRSLEKGQEALQDIKRRIAKLPKEQQREDIQLELMRLDLGDLQSVRDFVKEFQAKYEWLDILVNNAGFMDTNGTLVKTKDGFEQHIGVNHLGPFLLTRLLLDALKKGAPSRVVCVASSNMAIGIFDKDDFLMEKGLKTGDSGKAPYNLSKLYNAICIRMIAESLEKDSGVTVVQLCPGYVKTEVFRNEKGFFKTLFNGISLGVVGLSPHQGCETAVFCSVAKSVTDKENCGRGEFYRFMKIWEKGEKILTDYVASEDAKKLFQLSEELVGLREKS